MGASSLRSEVLSVAQLLFAGKRNIWSSDRLSTESDNLNRQDGNRVVLNRSARNAAHVFGVSSEPSIAFFNGSRCVS